MIEAFAFRWSLMKMAVGDNLGVCSDALHVLVGGLLFVGADVALRRSSPVLPWLILLGIEGANECLDLLRPPGGAENDLSASLHDVVLTMALPTMLALVSHGRGPSPPAARSEPLTALEQGTRP